MNWRLWCRTLGEKISENDKEADNACIIRTIYIIIMWITCFFIISNTIRHW
jgi:hypothetical protein